MQPPHTSADRPAGAADRWWPAVSALLLLVLLVLMLGLNLRRGLNHDEHQFVAGGVLLTQGLRPYAEYAYFHVPLLNLLYAPLFQGASQLLLAARLFSVAAGWLLALLLFWAGLRLPSGASGARRYLLALAAPLFLAGAPLFIFTSGRAWNHDLATLLAMAGVLLAGQGLAAPGTRWLDRRGLLLLAGGLATGLAAATRLSFAFTGLALLLAIWLVTMRTGGVRRRLLDTGFLAAGGLLGTAPAWIYLLQSPAGFLFGNLRYVQLNTLYYQMELPTYPGMTLGGKLEILALLWLTQPGHLFLLAPAAIALWMMARSGNLRRPQPLAALLALLSGLVGALTPTPVQTQYFYVLAPLLILWLLAAWPHLHPHRRGRLLPLVVAAAVASFLLALPGYWPGLRILPQPDEWYPRKIHARGELVADLTGSGSVLTLSPILPLEGDVPIYRRFATGPFAWRIAPLVDPATRVTQNLAAPADLPVLTSIRPPRGVLVGLDNDDAREEEPLRAWAEQAGYVPVDLPDEGVLWLSPLATWEETLTLGAHTAPVHAMAPGDEQVVTFYLLNRRELARNLNVLVRLVGRDGDEIWREEGWPWGSATSGWQPGQVWPDGHRLRISPDAAPGDYRLELGFYDPETLDEFGARQTVAYVTVGDPPILPDEPLARLGDDLELLSAKVTRQAEDGQSALAVELLWQAVEAPPAEAYTVFVHLLGPDGGLVAQRDRPPQDGFYPTTAWQPGRPVSDPLLLPLPPDLPPGEYRLVVGMYDAATVTPLPVYPGNAPPDAAPLGESFTVELVVIGE